jgi:hypothetical protein
LLALACLPFLPAAPPRRGASCGATVWWWERWLACRDRLATTGSEACTRHTFGRRRSVFGTHKRGAQALSTIIHTHQCIIVAHTRQRTPNGKGRRGSLGCSVNLPLGSRSVDPHSTAVWCGNLLHSSPQSHTADCVCHSSFDGVLATTTKICSGGRSSREQSQHGPQSPMPFLHNDALPRLPHRWQTVRDASLT